MIVQVQNYAIFVYFFVLQQFSRLYTLFFPLEKKSLLPLIPVEAPYGEFYKSRFTNSLDKLNEMNKNIDSVFYEKDKFKHALLDENNDIEKLWKTRILLENTPRGNVIMHYDPFKLGFAYYCDQHLPYDILNLVAMKYVTVYQCQDFFMDEHIRPDDKPSKILNLLSEDKKETTKTTATTTVEKKPLGGPFAKFKNYNKISARVESTKETEASTNDKLRNCFINRGKTCNFQFLQKSVLKKTGFSSELTKGLFSNSNVQNEVFSYRDFKQFKAQASTS